MGEELSSFTLMDSSQAIENKDHLIDYLIDYFLDGVPLNLHSELVAVIEPLIVAGISKFEDELDLNSDNLNFDGNEVPSTALYEVVQPVVYKFLKKHGISFKAYEERMERDSQVREKILPLQGFIQVALQPKEIDVGNNSILDE